MRGLFGLPFDDEGNIKAPAKELPRAPAEIERDEEALLEFLSPMLHVDGDKTESRQNSPEQLIINGVAGHRAIRANRETERFHYRVRAAALPAVANFTSKAVDWFREYLLRPLGLVDTLPERSYMANDMAHEQRRIITREVGKASDDLAELLGGDAFVGYTLHSAFAHNTRPAHAFRDGTKFYIDDREGSARPWADRIVPPYYFEDEHGEHGLVNGEGYCLCFTIPILETPEGDEYSAEFAIRTSGGRRITARDVGTLQTWFDQQRVAIRRATIGPALWDELDDAAATFADFFNPDGSQVSPKHLREESHRQKRKRARQTLAVMQAQHRRHVKSWDRFGYANRFSGDSDIERRYLQNLRRLLARWRVNS